MIDGKVHLSEVTEPLLLIRAAAALKPIRETLAKLGLKPKAEPAAPKKP